MSADHGSSHHDDGPPPPPEPKTPMWLPALGAALFLLVGLWWATRPEPPAPIAIEAENAGAITDAGAAPQAAQAGQQPGAAPQPLAAPQPQARPSGSGAAANGARGVDASQPLSPAQAAQLQKVLKGLGH